MQDKNMDLCDYRISLAKETLASAKLCLVNGFYRDCINRSYYTVFYAIKAVLAIEGIDFKRHKDVVAYFNKTYVVNEKFPRELGKRLGRIKMMREESDYSDFVVVAGEDAEAQVKTAEEMVRLVEGFLKEMV